MFTGLIQARGEVTGLINGYESMVLTFDAGDLSAEIAVGDSIAVNGVCLTATAIVNRKVNVDVMLQTLKFTSLKNLKIHEVLNLELAMRPTDRLGGHIVQGHVDGVGTVVVREPGDRWERLDIRVPKVLMKYVVAQGSITINGVSLTVGSINDADESITLGLIPETLTATNLGESAVGDLVNIEVDVLAKYVERLMQKRDNS
jgi:riboflavin synthase